MKLTKKRAEFRKIVDNVCFYQLFRLSLQLNQ